jgi:acyl carrier protein
MSISEYVTDYFLTKDYSGVLNKTSMLDLNYVEANFFSSIEFIEMISHFEDQFSIQFTDSYLRDPAFMKIGSLIKIIEDLMLEKV